MEKDAVMLKEESVNSGMVLSEKTAVICLLWNYLFGQWLRGINK
jgi:hypothetical protein